MTETVQENQEALSPDAFPAGSAFYASGKFVKILSWSDDSFTCRTWDSLQDMYDGKPGKVMVAGLTKKTVWVERINPEPEPADPDAPGVYTVDPDSPDPTVKTVGRYDPDAPENVEDEKLSRVAVQTPEESVEDVPDDIRLMILKYADVSTTQYGVMMVMARLGRTEIELDELAAACYHARIWRRIKDPEKIKKRVNSALNNIAYKCQLANMRCPVRRTGGVVVFEIPRWVRQERAAAEQGIPAPDETAPEPEPEKTQAISASVTGPVLVVPLERATPELIESIKELLSAGKE